MRPPPTFPLELDCLGPPEIVSALAPVELGALLLLLRAAWGQEPPCSVPDDDEAILRWSGLRPGERPGYLQTVRRLFIAGGEGRLVHETASRYWHRLDERASRRSAAGRAAIQSRWSRERGERGGGPEPPGGGRPNLRVVRPPGTEDGTDRIPDVYESYTNRIRNVPAAVPPHTPPQTLRSPDPAPALQRSMQSADPSERARIDAPVGLGAGARARPEEGLAEETSRRLTDLRVQRELAEARAALQRAEFEWCGDESRRRLFPSKVEELLRCPSATRLLETPEELPLLVDYALSEVRRMRPRSPMGMLVSALGAHRHRRTAPWVVPMWHREAWLKRREARAGALEVQARIDAMRAAKRTDTTASPRTGSA